MWKGLFLLHYSMPLGILLEPSPFDELSLAVSMD